MKRLILKIFAVSRRQERNGCRRLASQLLGGNGRLSFQPDLLFLILGNVLIFLASASLALGICVNHLRSVNINEIRADAKAEKTEKTAMMVENARKSARAERELNDFIAHEVQNPLSAAMTAKNRVGLEVASPGEESTT
jgi:signal transduction histidine kinase